MELTFKGEGTYSYFDATAGRSWEVESGESFTTTPEHGEELLAERADEFGAAKASAGKSSK